MSNKNTNIGNTGSTAANRRAVAVAAEGMDERAARRVQIITMAAVAVFFVLVLALLINIVSVVSLRARRNRLQAELGRVSSHNSQLSGEVDFKNTDAFVEQYAREVLGFIREGETVLEGR